MILTDNHDNMPYHEWWDYSNEPFQLCGYVCLKFSFLWGIACTLVLDVIHPTIYKMIQVFPYIPGLILLVLLLAVFATDLGITVAGKISGAYGV